MIAPSQRKAERRDRAAFRRPLIYLMTRLMVTNMQRFLKAILRSQDLGEHQRKPPWRTGERSEPAAEGFSRGAECSRENGEHCRRAGEGSPHRPEHAPEPAEKSGRWGEISPRRTERAGTALEDSPSGPRCSPQQATRPNAERRGGNRSPSDLALAASTLRRIFPLRDYRVERLPFA